MTDAPEFDTRPLGAEQEPLAAAETPVCTGMRLEGGYLIGPEIGRGAMGVVFRGWDERLERTVAIKVMRHEAFMQPQWRRQFHAEAKAMAKVHHQNVVEIHALGFVAGVPYLVMEHVDGPDLRSFVANRDEPLSLDDALALISAVCRGTQAMHLAGTVHRDLKPRNVLVDRTGTVKISDFGLARPIGERGDINDWVLAGTPAYVAPEIVTERDVPAELAPRADVYALGIMAYELLTRGALPYEGRASHALLQAHVYEDPIPPSARRPELSEAFDEVFVRVLAKEPSERIATPDEFRRALARAREQARIGRGGPRLLIVDDDADHRELVRTLIERRLPEASVIEAEDGAEAMACIEESEPDLALVDLHMPTVDGVELTRRMRARSKGRRIPVVILTGRGGAAHWKVLRRLGADGFLVKPIDAESLVSAVQRYLGPARAESD